VQNFGDDAPSETDTW